jgi:PKD domain-containing protein
MRRTTHAVVRFAFVIGMSLVGAWSPSAAAQQQAAPCPAGQMQSTAYTDEEGIVVEGGKCIPGSTVPGDATYWYEYEPVCQPNTGTDPTSCAQMRCDTAPAPAFVFGVIRTSVADPTMPEYRGAGCYTVDDQPPRITPARVLKVLERTPIAPAAITVQPPGGRTLINFKTIVSTEATEFEETVRILGQEVHLWIRPVSFRWDFGDGTTLTRDDPGIAWKPGTEEVTEEFTYHEYLETGDYRIGLTVAWTADFAVGDADPEPVDGTVEITTPPVGITAIEARPHLVG